MESCVSPITRLEFVCTCVTCRQCDDGQLHLRRFHVATQNPLPSQNPVPVLGHFTAFREPTMSGDARILLIVCACVIWMLSLPVGSATRDQDTALVHASTHHSPLRGH